MVTEFVWVRDGNLKSRIPLNGDDHAGCFYTRAPHCNHHCGALCRLRFPNVNLNLVRIAINQFCLLFNRLLFSISIGT